MCESIPVQGVPRTKHGLKVGPVANVVGDEFVKDDFRLMHTNGKFPHIWRGPGKGLERLPYVSPEDKEVIEGNQRWERLVQQGRGFIREYATQVAEVWEESGSGVKGLKKVLTQSGGNAL